MRRADVEEFLQAQPFHPFRLLVLENTVFEVRHPEFAFVTHSTLHLTHSPGPLRNVMSLSPSSTSREWK
jgi:hypothetical protein